MAIRWSDIDPRRSLAAALGLGLATVSLVGAAAASWWIGEQTYGRIALQTGAVFEQYATQLSNELDINLDAKLQWLRAAADIYGGMEIVPVTQGEAAAARSRLALKQFRDRLSELDWVGFADAAGRIRSASAGEHEGESAATRDWFKGGRTAPWIGSVQLAPPRQLQPHVGVVELSAPVVDARGRFQGVLGAELGWNWARALGTALTASLRTRESVQALLLDNRGMVLLGPQELVGQIIETPVSRSGSSGNVVATWPDGRRYLAGWAASDGFGAVPALGWTVWVREPVEHAFDSAGRQRQRVFLATVLLGVVTAVAGILLAQRLTRELARMASSADEIRAGQRVTLEVPAGDAEAARIGHSMQALLDQLHQRTAAVEQLNAELDVRVAARTHEVERMADENRHAAVVRERLRLARDLHDTLAHTLMAVLTELRLIRKLARANPAALEEELARAEAAAQEGLREARSAIAQLRRDTVVDMGLGEALRELASRFQARNGVPVEVDTEPEAGTMADARAQSLYRIAQEALRNVERHAGATRVRVALRDDTSGPVRERVLVVSDDGVGFDASQPPPTGHFGLQGMAEQAQLMGARLLIDSTPEHGTHVQVRLAA